MQTEVFLICLFVFLLLTIGLSFLVYELYHAYVLNIRNGSCDNEIIEELKEQKQVKTRNKVVNIILSIIIVLTCSVSIFFAVNSNKPVGNVSMPKVVLSGSMSSKNEKNTYLIENNLNNQIGLSDLIILDKKPENLKLYDIVLYKNKKGQFILHRIVKITTDEYGKTCYGLQGDANPVMDPDPVYYEQVMGIYNGIHVKYIGRFIKFLQSYSGMLCIGLAIFVVIVYPTVDKKLEDVKNKRREKLNDNFIYHKDINENK